MMSKIRLAERRGCLRRERISQVQSDALEVLVIEETWNRNTGWELEAKRHLEMLKATLVGSDRQEVQAVFPEWFAGSRDDVIEAPADEDEITLGDPTSWSSTPDTPTPDFVQSLLSQLTSGTGSISLDGGWQ